MTRIKRLVAVALAFLMMFSSLSVAASAFDPMTEDSNDVSVTTEIYRTEADGDLVATDKVKKGETVNVKVYADTSYFTGDGTLLFFYNNNFFEGSVSNFKVGSTYSALPIGMTAEVATEDNSDAEDLLVLLGVIDQTFADENNFVLINYALNSNSQNIRLDGDEVLFEMDIKVRDDATADKVGKFFIKDSTVLSTKNTYGEVNIPKGPNGGYNEDCYSMDAWNPNFTYPESTVTLFENFVSATFNADGGSVNGKSVEIMEGEAGAALTIAEPTKEFNKFSGWLAENATATAPVTAFPSADTTYTAQWESTSTTDKNLAFKTEFYRFDGTDWVQTDRVKRGEEVRLRLFVDTSYYTNAGEIILFYDKDFFINPTSVEADVSNDLTFNTDPASSAAITGANGDYMLTSKDNFVIEDLVSNNCITQEFADTYGAYTISYNFKPTTGKMLSNEYWFAEIPMIVSTTASGTGDCFIEENTLLTPTREGYINIPVSADGLEDSESQGLWLHNVNFSEESHPVSIDSKITFNANGGAFAEGDPNEYVIEGIIGDAVDADLIPELTKAGSTFLGWAVEGTTDIIDVPTEIPYDDLVLVAQWISKFDITVHPNNGDPDYTLTVTPNEPFEALEVPVLEGNRFLGWTTDKDLKEITGLPATYTTEETDYYAVFESRVYKVSYYVLDAETDTFSLVCKTGTVYGEVIESVPSVYTVPTGYELSKAYTDLAFKNEFVEGTTMPANDVTLYYTLKAKTYDATFNANGGAFADGTDSKVVPTVYEAEIVAPAAPVRDGYTFTGWTPAVGIMDAEGKTFTATWDADTYTVEYYKDGILYEAFDVDYEDSLDVPADPVKEGYEFVGWADVKIAEPADADIISPEALAAQTMPKNDLQYKAVFEINTYTATFDAGEDAEFPNDDDEDVTTEEVEVVYGEAVTLPEDPNNPGKTFVPVKEGYTFTGWADENGNAPGKMPAGDTTYTATWQVNKYNLVFIKDADVLVNKQVEFGAALAAETPDADAVAKEGYTFEGWTPTVADTMPAEDVVYIATYTVNTYTAAFNAGEGTFAEAGEDGDNKNETVKTAYGAELKVPALAENEGYVFAGWTDTEGSTTVVDVPVTQPADNLTYYAVWTPATDTPYEVYVYTQGTDGKYGEPTVFAKTGTTGENAEYVPAPETGFHVSDTETNVLSAPIAADGTTDLIVYYDRDIVTITFAATEADATLTAVEKTDYLYGSIVAVPTATRDGYEFAGWALATDDTKTVVDVQTLAETSADYVATWAAKTYTVTYLADGVQVAQDEILCGATVTMNTVEPTKTGYTFDKAWTITDENGAQVDYVFGGTMGAENIVLNAKFSPNPYDAVFYEETTSTEAYDTVEVNYDATVTAPATNPSKTGYEFAGWSTNGADVLADLGKMDSTEGKKFYAVWTPVEVDYKVEHYLMDTEGNYSTAPEVEALKALTDSKVTATVKTIEGFTQDMDANLATVTEATVAADGSTVLKVYYERNKYALTIDRDNGEAAEVIEYYFEEAVDTVTAENLGYVFVEWVDENGNSTDVPAKMPAKDTYIKAIWEADSFDVTYMDGDKVHDASSSVYGEDVYLAYADPTKAGYKFAGWVDEDGKKPSDYASMPAKDLTFNATWTERTDMAYSTEIYEMDANGDYQLKSKETKTDGVTNGTVTLSYTVPAGFHLDETQANVLEGTIPETGMLTLVAYLARNEHVVKTTVDGTATEKTYLFGAAIDTIADPEKEGYTFLGWYDESNTKVTIPAKMEDEDIIVEAKFDVLSYDLTFEPDNGSAATVSKAAYGSKITVPAEPTKTGYDFAGWFTADGKQPADYETMPNNALTFTAEWTPSTDTEYKVITYVMNTEGVLEKQSEETRTGTTGETAKAETVDMDGFYVTTDSVTEATIAADGSTVLVVNYAREQFTVIFDATENGKFADNNQKVTKEYYYGATVEVPADPTKSGFSFVEWKPSVSATVVADANYTAQWKADTFTITFNEDGGSEVDDITAEAGTAVKAPVTTKDNFKFLGWFEDGATTAYVFDKMPASNVTLTAKWEEIKYTITFDEDGGSAVNDIEATAGTAVSAPADPAKTGYTFKGWYELDSETAYVFDKMPAANVQLKAKWEVITYTATFNTGSDAKFPDDTTSKTTEAGYGENVAAPVDPVKEGNTFTGWVDAEGKPMGTMPEGGATYTPTWAVNSYTLIFVKDGEEISRDSVEYGAKIAPYEPAAELVAKKGYNHTGWTGYTDLTNDPAMPAQEVVYYATYEAADFTATFNSGDGTLADGTTTSVVTTAYGETIVVPAVTAPQGYDFAGWTDTEGSEEIVTVPTTQPAEALTYYAVFTPSKDTKYTVEVYTQKTDKTYDMVPFERTGTTGAEVEEKTNPAPGFHLNTQTSVLTGTVAADESTVLKVYYDRDVFEIVFNGAGGVTADNKGVVTESYLYGQTVSVPTFSRTGFKFLGWDKDVVLVATEAATYVAQWDALSYTVTYIANGEVVAEDTFDFGDIVTKTTVVPTLKGHEFSHWYETDEDLAYTFGGTMGAKNIVLTAKFAPLGYTASFYKELDDTTAFTTVDEITFGTDITAPDDEPKKTGYTFGGWSTDGKTPLASLGQMTEEGMSFYAVWVPAEVKYIVEHYKMDATGNYSYAYDTENLKAATGATVDAVVRDIEHFELDADNADNVLSAEVAANGSTVLKVYYERNKYALTINRNNDTEAETNEYYYEQTVPAATDMTKEGHQFSHWVNTATNETVEYPATLTADLSIKAEWTANVHTLTYNIVDDEGKVTEVWHTQSLAYGQPVYVPGNPGKIGYRFGGWIDADSKQPSDYGTMPDKDLVFVAQWAPDENIGYKIYIYEMDVNGAYPDAPTTILTFTDGVVGEERKPSITVPTGFILNTEKSDIDEGGIIPAPSVGELVLKAYLDRNQWTLTTVVDGKNTEYKFYYQQPVSIADPDVDGTEFLGWFDSADYNNEVAIAPTMPNNDVTVYAKLNVLTYNIKFDAGEGTFKDGSHTSESDLTFGTDIAAPADPEREGFTFGGWADSTAPDVKVEDFGTVGEEDVTYVAIWTQSAYSVKFYDYSNSRGPAVGTEKYLYDEAGNLAMGAAIPFPADPEIANYVFKGWAESENDLTNIYASDATMPARDLVLYAVYERVQVMLIPEQSVENCTTVIDRAGLTVDKYDAATSQWYVYGLVIGINETKLHNEFIDVQGDGYAKVTVLNPNFGDKTGTGAIIDVYDNVTGKLVESFRVIIFGDLNGDARVDSTDDSIVSDEILGITSWQYTSSPEYTHYIKKAADLNGDGRVNVTDGSSINSHVLGSARIVQIDGSMKYA